MILHIRDVLQNIDRFYGHSLDRQNLRLIALIHDTFKYQAAETAPGAAPISHGAAARAFAERYLQDFAVLEVLELHDEAYKAWRLLARHGNRAAAERQAGALITRLGPNLGLFLRFYRCDNHTGDKTIAAYAWFRRLAESEAHGRPLE